MKKKTFLYITLISLYIFCGTTKCFSQESASEIEAVTRTINNYFEGYIERDSLKLANAFDIKNGTMKVPIIVNGSVVGYENKYFKNLLSIWSNREKLSEEELKECKLQIVNIDIESNKIGTAKIVMKVSDVTYIDILSLQRILNEWRITNKIYFVQE